MLGERDSPSKCLIPMKASGEFRAWLAWAVFRANSEQIPSEFRAKSWHRAIPSKHPKPLYLLVSQHPSPNVQTSGTLKRQLG